MNVAVTFRAAILAAAIVVAAPVRGLAQQQTQTPPAPPPGIQDPGPLGAGQIQRWFEAFTVLQAQEALRLSETQYGRFVTRLKALQETRRKHQQARAKILNDLRKLTAGPQSGTLAPPPNDDAQITERLKALREEDDRGAAELRKGYEGVDETLDVSQQARFRVFEERMEQQKLELLMRARLNARNAARGRGRGSL